MAFHGVMVVRDEGDIIAQVLSHLLGWCDTLSVMDTGSTDGTLEIVEEASRRDARVRVFGERVAFHNGLRAVLFDRVRHRFGRGDWVARLDGDELYHTPPPEFVARRVGPDDGRIFAQMYDFLITRAEAAAWERGEETLSDRARPIQERRTRYVIQEFPEPRLFRYRRRMIWPGDSYVPLRGGLVARARIPVLHYRWRDPVQAAARCALRREMRAAGARVGPHWALADWREWLANDDDPRLLRYTRGAELPDPALTNHLPRPLRRAGQRLLYRSGGAALLDWLDGMRWRPRAGAGAGRAGPPLAAR